MKPIIQQGNCTEMFEYEAFTNLFGKQQIDLTFLDPPFNQDKDYSEWDDNLPENEYWNWMQDICRKIFTLSSEGSALYFMQREKNTEQVLRCLREAGWTFQNLIIWKKKTSAIPGTVRYGKHYQIIAFVTKGNRPRMFHRLRINPPLPAGYKLERENGMYVTDVWDDIRELTSGYFAGEEALRDKQGNRIHKQQSPIQLLLRILLSSTSPSDFVLDPFAGTGTTLVAAQQLDRNSIGIELDKHNVRLIERRIREEREADLIKKFYKDYEYTSELDSIWGINNQQKQVSSVTNRTRAQQHLFEQITI
jgi:DNA modification methylase